MVKIPFFEKLLLLDQPLEITSWTELSHNVAVIFAGENIIAFNNIGMVKVSEDLDLVSEKLFFNLVC